jgi:hypothetical protein
MTTAILPGRIGYSNYSVITGSAKIRYVRIVRIEISLQENNKPLQKNNGRLLLIIL